jgi:NAD+ kinase
MKIAIFGKQFGEVFYEYSVKLFRFLEERHVDIIIYRPFYEFLEKEVRISPQVSGYFADNPGLTGVDLVFSIGGDGTFLEAVTYVKDSGIPIVGINSGRLGFLAVISKEEIENALEDIVEGRYKKKKLDLLTAYAGGKPLGSLNFALNELAITKIDSSAMITVHTYLDDVYMNSYWADGLIIATSTGSTAYSLSVAGPILHPETSNFVITPIAPHNLTVRPMVVPNDLEVRLNVEARAGKFLASLDSRSRIFDEHIEIKVRKADFQINVVDLTDQSFYATLRNKLMWGVDKRN